MKVNGAEPPQVQPPAPPAIAPAADGPAAVAPPAAEEQTRVLASAVYGGGSLPLEIGLRYMLAVTGREFEIRGPVDRDPNAVAFATSVESLDVVGMDDRLTISSAGSARRSFAVGFVSLSGDTAAGFEQRIAAEQARTIGSR